MLPFKPLAESKIKEGDKISKIKEKKKRNKY